MGLPPELPSSERDRAASGRGHHPPRRPSTGTGSQKSRTSAPSSSSNRPASPPCGRWLDACAGAGGKTLQLAGLLGRDGQASMRTTSESDALLTGYGCERSAPGLSGRRSPSFQGPAGDYDGVLVDAPLLQAPEPGGVRPISRQSRLPKPCARRRRGSWNCSPPIRRAPASRRTPHLRHLLALPKRKRGSGGRVPPKNSDYAPVHSAHLLGGERRGAGTYFWPNSHDGDGFFEQRSLRRR